MFKTPALRHHDYDLPRQVFAGGILQVEGDHLMMFLQVATGESAYDGGIYLTHSYNGGNTWGPPTLVVDTDDVNDNTPQAIVRDGTLYLIYTRKTTESNIINQVWYRTSTDWATQEEPTWSADTQIDTGHYYNIIGQPILLSNDDIFVPLAYNRGAESGAREGTYTGGYTLGTTGLISGDVDDAVELNGTTGWISIPASGLNMPTSGWTLIMWIDMDAAALAADRLQVLIDKSGLSAGNGQYFVFYDNRSSQGSPKRLRFQHGTGASINANWNNADTDLAAGGMLACVCEDDGTLRIYWNGTLKASSASPVSATDGTNVMGVAIGKTSGASTNWLDAVVDDTAFIIDALSSGDISALYATRTTSPYGFRDEILDDPDLFAYWRFNESAGTTAQDYSNDNDGFYRCTSATFDGATWTVGGDVDDPEPASTRGLLEPEVIQTDDGDIHMYMRTTSGFVWYTVSSDDGATWSTPVGTTHSGVDGHVAVTKLADGAIVMAGIAQNSAAGTPRRPLSFFYLTSPTDFAERATQIADSGDDSDDDRFISQQLGQFSGGTYDGYIFGNYWYQDASVSPNTIDSYFFRISQDELRSCLRKKTHGGIWADAFINDDTLSAPHSSYIKVEGASGAFVTTTSDRLQYDTVEANNTHCLQESGIDDFAMQFISRKITAGGTSNNGGTFRYSDSTHYWRVDNFNGNLRLVKVNNDGGTVVDTTVATTDTVTDYRYMIVANGNDIDFYRDGVLQLEASDSFNNTATKHGMWNSQAQGQIDSLIIMRGSTITIQQVPRGYAAALKNSDGDTLVKAVESSGTITLDITGVGEDTGTVIDFPNDMYIQVYKDDTYTTSVSNGRYPQRGHSWDIYGGDVYQLPPQPSAFMVS